MKTKDDSDAIYMRNHTPPLPGGTWQCATGKVLTVNMMVCAAKNFLYDLASLALTE